MVLLVMIHLVLNRCFLGCLIFLCLHLEDIWAMLLLLIRWDPLRYCQVITGSGIGGDMVVVGEIVVCMSLIWIDSILVERVFGFRWLEPAAKAVS